jgi:hypothetical protein
VQHWQPVRLDEQTLALHGQNQAHITGNMSNAADNLQPRNIVRRITFYDIDYPCEGVWVSITHSSTVYHVVLHSIENDMRTCNDATQAGPHYLAASLPHYPHPGIRRESEPIMS